VSGLEIELKDDGLASNRTYTSALCSFVPWSSFFCLIPRT